MGKDQRRRRRSRADWVEIVGRFDESGLSIRDFCKREGLALSSFQRWQRRLETVTESAFTEIVSPVASAADPWLVEIEFPSGVVLRIRG
jgi:hypothetical protein